MQKNGMLKLILKESPLIKNRRVRGKIRCKPVLVTCGILCMLCWIYQTLEWVFPVLLVIKCMGMEMYVYNAFSCREEIDMINSLWQFYTYIIRLYSHISWCFSVTSIFLQMSLIHFPLQLNKTSLCIYTFFHPLPPWQTAWLVPYLGCCE